MTYLPATPKFGTSASFALGQAPDLEPLPIVVGLPRLCPGDVRAIDIGTGTGRNAIHLARHGISVDAIDRSPASVHELNHYAESLLLPIRARVFDIRESEPELQFYELVVCTFMLHFLTAVRATALLANARRCATAGTLHAVAAITSDGDFAPELARKERFCPDRDELCRDYLDAGWKIERSYNQRRMMLQRRHDGLRMHNIVSFVVARKQSRAVRPL